MFYRINSWIRSVRNPIYLLGKTLSSTLSEALVSLADGQVNGYYTMLKLSQLEHKSLMNQHAA